MPYLYSQAYRVWARGATIMRMLAFDFADDEIARLVDDQFLFGESLMVCPVTGPTGQRAEGAGAPATRDVYLPQHPGGWYDFHTSQHHPGGGWVAAPADLETIPVFVKAGTVLPTCSPAASTDELDLDELHVRVYRGRDGAVELYDDAGDGYQYEQGDFALTVLTWDDMAGELTVGEPQGGYGPALAGRRYTLEVIG